MSSRWSGPPLRIEPAPSRALARLHALAHLLAAISLLLLPLPPWLRAGGCAGIALAWWLDRGGRAGLPGRRRIESAILFPDNTWEIVAADGERSTVVPVGGALNARWLVSLTLRDRAGRTRRLTVPRDAIAETDFRSLRLRLRTAPGTANKNLGGGT